MKIQLLYFFCIVLLVGCVNKISLDASADSGISSDAMPDSTLADSHTTNPMRDAQDNEATFDAVAMDVTRTDAEFDAPGGDVGIDTYFGGRDVPRARCPIDEHVSRIMEGQANVATCVIANPLGAREQEFADYRQCVLDAWSNNRPFRALPVGRHYAADDPPRIELDQITVLGRLTVDGFQCIELRSLGIRQSETLEVLVTSLTRTAPTFTRGSDPIGEGVNYPWLRTSCAPDLTPNPHLPAAYDPPRVLPLGQVCPRD